MITSRDPVRSALWFAAVVLATAGLFLLAGAQFLAAGTVIVYAGAIIVTFLFVLMLAQMEGRAAYDRAARAPGAATFSCFLLLWALLNALIVVRSPLSTAAGGRVVKVFESNLLYRTHQIVVGNKLGPQHPIAVVLARSSPPTAQLPDPANPASPHVAGLGGTLFSDHLVVVELAGTLLFVALVAAVVIAAPKPPIRPGDRRPESGTTPDV
jgi:NADH-quinone oxidoreductase subunit J